MCTLEKDTAGPTTVYDVSTGGVGIVGKANAYPSLTITTTATSTSTAEAFLPMVAGSGVTTLKNLFLCL